MIFIKWLAASIFDSLLAICEYIAAPALSLFTADGWPEWGGWLWTYDNPPEGDEGFNKKRAPFIPANTSFERYANRVAWLWRNPTYGYSKYMAIYYGSGLTTKIIKSGGAGIDTSDKYRDAGWYYAECRNTENILMAFEFYGVFPYSKNNCLRARIGWKIMSDKFKTDGFAPLVHMINPFKYYGESVS